MDSTDTTVQMWRSVCKDNLQELVLCFHRVGLRDQIQVIRLSSKYFAWPAEPSCWPLCLIFNQMFVLLLMSRNYYFWNSVLWYIDYACTHTHTQSLDLIEVHFWKHKVSNSLYRRAMVRAECGDIWKRPQSRRSAQLIHIKEVREKAWA